tara:strand:- start:226 stop:378 length:153 start_codon:yes stop_codon:yes gene_type:complete
MSYKQLTTSQIENINSILAMQKIVADCNRRMQEAELMRLGFEECDFEWGF